MAKVKNSFLKSKMNKDLDNRLIPNGEYRNAVNITVNNSDGEDVGTAQNVRGNLEVIDFTSITGVSNLEVVGLLDDEYSSTVFAFLANNNGLDYEPLSYSAVVSWNVNEATTSAKVIVEGNWLNFSKLNPVIANLLEDLLFFTDNRNQPRKVNINYQTGYYTTEDQISVAKYYPYEAIQLFNPSEVPATVVATALTTIASTSSVLTLDDATGVVIGQGVLGTGILLNSFVVGINGLEITLNQNANVALGATIEFVSVETSMKDAISEFLPPKGEGTVAVPITTTTEFSLTNYVGYVNVTGNVSGGIGFSVFKRLGSDFIDTGSKVISVEKTTTPAPDNVPVLQIEVDQAPSPALALDDEVLLAIPNPYYDINFAQTANVDYLEDKFVRFSYRFKFDDGEYSLIAPFTQPCFIPQQDGYFLTPESIGKIEEGINEDLSVEISDEKRAYKSTEVSFMENKVNKITLNIPLPYTAGTMQSSLKIQEIDILYKESDEIAIKVVETIPVNNSSFSGNNVYFQYEYGSKSPYKSLPEKENTRVYDKVPVKAQSQEIISNRVVYANYQDKHTPPNFLNYNLAATDKRGFGTDFANFGTSKIEYPNATLKQNRNYEVGVVLSDRFGRQSTVILSESEFNLLPSYLASTIYNPFRDESDQLNSPAVFDGESLKVTFNNLIPSSYINSPGLYNGNQTSDDYNPLGWYSFKIVVKQTEQEYYNAYVAPVMVGYPLDPNKETFETSHISLFGDNINKIPRDLSELGPTQKQFRSSVKLWPRVACDKNVGIVSTKLTNQTSPVGGSPNISLSDVTGLVPGMGVQGQGIPGGATIALIDTINDEIGLGTISVEVNSGVTLTFTNGSTFFNNLQFFPERIGDIASAIGTIDDLFEIPKSDPASRFKGSSETAVGFQSNVESPNQIKLLSVPGGGSNTLLEQRELRNLYLTLKVGDQVISSIYPSGNTVITSIQSTQDPSRYIPLGQPNSDFRLTLSDPPDPDNGLPSTAGLYVGFSSPGGPEFFYDQDSDPLIARISTTKQAGVEVPPGGYPTAGGTLNVYEVEAQESLLDIYWETSTSGLISELNTAISEGPDGLVYSKVKGWNPLTLTELTHEGDNFAGIFVSSFKAVLENETSIQPLNLATAVLVSVYEQGSPANTNNLLGNPYKDQFVINSNPGTGSFNIKVIDPSGLVVTTGNNDLTFEIAFNHPNQDPQPLPPPFIAYLDAAVNNIAPIIDTCPSAIPTITNPKNTFIYDFTGVNGSFTQALNQLDLTWSLSPDTNNFLFSIGNDLNPTSYNWGQLRANQFDTPQGDYDIGVILTDGGGESVECNFQITYDYEPDVDFLLNIDSLQMTNQPGGGGSRLEVENGEFTITNAPAGNIAFQIRGVSSSVNNPAIFSVQYRLQIYDDNGIEVADMQTSTQNAPDSNTNTNPTYLGNGDYTFTITISSLNFPITPLTTALATVIQPY